MLTLLLECSMKNLVDFNIKEISQTSHLTFKIFGWCQKWLWKLDFCGLQNSQFHIAPHELKKIAQAKKSIPFYVIKRAKKFFFRFFHFLGCLWAPKNIYPRKKFKFLRGPPGAPPCEKKCLLKAKMSFFMP